MRGLNYIWADDLFHIWVGDGAEDVSSIEWAKVHEAPGGVSISKDAMNEFVIMRFAELWCEDKENLLTGIETFTGENTNFGADALRSIKDKLTKCVASFEENV